MLLDSFACCKLFVSSSPTHGGCCLSRSYLRVVLVNISDVNKDWTCKDKDKDFTYSYLLQVAAKPTIAIK